MEEVDVDTIVRPRALVFSLFGDYVRYQGGELRLKALVALGEELGVAGPTMRVMAARLRDEGWLDVRREGRESIYTLTPKLLRTIDGGRRRIFREPLPAWSGEWSMVIYSVPETDRSTREQLRRDLSWLGFGPLAPATWVSPHPRLDDVAAATAGLVSVRLELLTMKTAGLPSDRSIAGRCWDLESLNASYTAFNRELRRRLATYRQGHLDGREAMRERIHLVQEYRGFLLADPDLPEELQPSGWVGGEAYRLFSEAHDLLETAAASHYEDVFASISRIPAATPD